MISLVTTTSGRPLCFGLLEKWIARQTVQPDEWIVVTDDWRGYTFNMGQRIIKRKPKKDPLPSICMNWLEAIPLIKGNVVPVEDDDWYHPTYLESLLPCLSTCRLAGISGSRYYKLPIRKYHHQGNVDHAALSATCFRRELLPLVERCKIHKSVFIDAYLWAEATADNLDWMLIPNKAKDGRALHVGMKMMPGKAGLGVGHAQDGVADPGFERLRAWIGPEDCRTYTQIPKSAWGKNG